MRYVLLVATLLLAVASMVQAVPFSVGAAQKEPNWQSWGYTVDGQTWGSWFDVDIPWGTEAAMSGTYVIRRDFLIKVDPLTSGLSEPDRITWYDNALWWHHDDIYGLGEFFDAGEQAGDRLYWLTLSLGEDADTWSIYYVQSPSDHVILSGAVKSYWNRGGKFYGILSDGDTKYDGNFAVDHNEGTPDLLNGFLHAGYSDPDALLTGGSRLAQTQHTDGAWGWPLNAPPTWGNIHGPIGMGVVRAYLFSRDPMLLASLQKASDYLRTKTIFSLPDGYLAAELDSILGGTANRDYVKANFFDKLANGTYLRDSVYYDTAGWVNRIRTARASQGLPNLAAWDVALGIVGSSACGANPIEWIAGTKAEIDELAPGSGDNSPVLGLAGALWGLAYVGEEFDPTAGMFASDNSLADLANSLAGYQIAGSGGFTSDSAHVEAGYEDPQTTAYAVLALQEAGGHKPDIVEAASYLESAQMATGGWSGSGENNEVTAEAVAGLSAVNNLTLDVPQSALYLMPGESFVLDVRVSNLTQEVGACQTMLGYNSTYLNAADVIAGGGVWNDLIYRKYSVPGQIDTAVGVNAESTAGTDADGTVAKITLSALAPGITRVVFRPDLDPDPYLVGSTFLSDMSSRPVWPNKWDSQTIVIDGTAPSINIAHATQSGNELLISLGSTTNTLQGQVDIDVTASDALSGLAGPPTVTVTDSASNSLPVTYDGQSPVGTFNYHVTVLSTTANGIATINATVSDNSGNSASDSDTFNINKNQIAGSVELENYLGSSRPVTMVATGGTSTNTWTVTATGTVTAFTLTDVPNGTTHLSGKTAWNLRRKVALGGGVDGQWTADLTGANKLLGGDINGSNSVNILDYTILKTNWFTGNAVADINGDGLVQTLDYGIMKSNWFKVGDAQ